MKKKVLIVHGHSSIEIFHTLVPFFLLSEKETNYIFEFLDYRFFKNSRNNADILILVRKYHSFSLDEESNRNFIIDDIKKYKDKYTKVIYFDDAAAISHILFFIIPYVDAYWVRGLLKDKRQYQKKYIGGRTYSDYYLKKYNLKDLSNNFSPAFSFKNQTKIKIAWNIGIGCFPLFKNKLFNKYYFFVRRFCCVLSFLSLNFLLKKIILFYINQMKSELRKDFNINDKVKKISARFTYKGYYNSVGFQRKLALEKINNKKIYLTGKLKLWPYLKECNKILGTLSPFGWGEICYRDFEASLNQNLLIKPDIDHLETWPNIYTKDSYYKLSWDLENLNELEEYICKNKTDIKSKIKNSRSLYLEALNQSCLRAQNLLDQI